VRRIMPDERIVGFARQPCFGGCLKPKINYYDQRDGKQLGIIGGPCCCIGGMCDSEFQAVDMSGNNVASIKRGGITSNGVRRALLSDADKYVLQINDPNESLDTKLIILSSVMFIDYMFFEGETNCLMNWCTCPPYCLCKLCDLYCCGVTVPLRLNCCVPPELLSKTPAAL